MNTAKKALVTGASRGIGKAIALELASRGCEVGLHYHHSRAEAEEVARIISEAGGLCYLFQADLADHSSLIQMGSEAWDTMKGIDYLVNNAGVSFKKHFLEVELDELDVFLNVNLKGTFVLTQLIAKKMIAHNIEGSIYTITSVNGIRPGLGFSAYGASKGALEIMMQAAALELAPHNIKVNTVALGAIRTDINATVWQDPELLKSVNEGIPLNRFGEPNEIASVIADLLKSGSYLTGSTIVLDGGLLLMRGYGKPEKFDQDNAHKA